jgi:hypothetical protein
VEGRRSAIVPNMHGASFGDLQLDGTILPSSLRIVCVCCSCTRSGVRGLRNYRTLIRQVVRTALVCPFKHEIRLNKKDKTVLVTGREGP